MPKKLLYTLLCLGVLTVSTVSAHSQTEITVRPGDSIEWYAISAGPHGVKFGSDGGSPINEVEALLEFTPGLNNGESESKPTGRVLSAKVRDNAEIGKKFTFVCAIHPGPMVSHPFKVVAKDSEPTRTHKIIGVTGLHWAVHVDTTAPPPPQ